jgi:cytoskeletal protein RodZ
MIGRRTAPSTPETAKPKGFDDFDLRLGDLMRGERATLGKSLLDVQRELKIKATYIAAIENADVSAFETQGFIAGYVRSYARYLGMNPDWAYEKFCREANFTLAHGMSQAASPARITAVRNRAAEYRDPFADPNASFVPRAESVFNRIEPGAIGSLAVLVALIAGIGYGGWSVLQQVQQVQLAPVDQAPRVVTDIDPLGNVPGQATNLRSAPEVAEAAPVLPATGDIAADISPLADRSSRPEALDTPVLVPRDGPIAAINPRNEQAVAKDVAHADAAETAVQVVASVAPGVEVVAVRPSWVRVKAADGTVLFEKILDAGEGYVVPQMETPASLRAGNSGSVYFRVNGQTYGPAAPGAQVVDKIALSPESLTQSYALADMNADPDLTRYASNAGTPTADVILPVPEVPQN